MSRGGNSVMHTIAASASGRRRSRRADILLAEPVASRRSAGHCRSRRPATRIAVPRRPSVSNASSSASTTPTVTTTAATAWSRGTRRAQDRRADRRRDRAERRRRRGGRRRAGIEHVPHRDRGHDHQPDRGEVEGDDRRAPAPLDERREGQEHKRVPTYRTPISWRAGIRRVSPLLIGSAPRSRTPPGSPGGRRSRRSGPLPRAGDVAGRPVVGLPRVGLQTVPVSSRTVPAWRAHLVPETKVAFAELLGRRVRMGTWEDQKVSTYRKIVEAFDEGRWDEAATLASYFIDEANVCFTLYRQWIADLTGFLRDNGVAAESSQPATTRRPALATLPDGSPWQPRKHWDRFLTRDAGRDRGRVPRAAGRRQGGAGRRQGDVAAVPRSRRRPHLRDDVAGQGAARRGRDPGRCTTGCCCRCSSGATRSSTSTSTPGTRRSRR